MTAEELAELFHTTYERLAPAFGWNGPRVTRCNWVDLPPNNQALMVATAAEVLKALEQEYAEDEPMTYLQALTERDLMQ